MFAPAVPKKVVLQKYAGDQLAHTEVVLEMAQKFQEIQRDLGNI
jgi:1,2-phenylacetyl-CoA epoxidase catalytic subunit